MAIIAVIAVVLFFLTAWVCSLVFGLVFPGSGLDNLSMLEIIGFWVVSGAIVGAENQIIKVVVEKYFS